ncbi:1-phosphatidylinositol 3-phosphate 5-kinase-like isoform X1 [Mytilus trossulus]|uniref:1-phosphatidylinositol 3-phosphate 5-kinase-like isoform X1 n=1 Tax=Mytilus trossulus TaxID=6551 RepID=UPI0030046DCB
MSQWDEPPTTLTSFGPLSSDISEGGSLFTRLWNRKKNGSRSASREGSTERKPKTTDKEVLSASSPVSDDKPVEDKPSLPQVKHVVKPSLPDIYSTATARTLTGVLNRLSSIVRTGTPQTYKDSDFKQYWMPDESCRECYDCGDKFTTFRRRHHCRICGQIFCSKCCNQELQGRIIGYKGGIRVCTYCGKVAMSALQNDSSGHISVDDKEELQLSMDPESQVYSLWGSKKRTSQDLARSSSILAPGTPSIDVLIPFDLSQSSSETDMNTGLGRKFLEDSVQLRDIWRQIVDQSKGVEMQSHRIRLKTYYKCIVGNKLVDWLLSNDKAAQRMQAVVIGQALLDAGYLEIIGGQQNIFQDNFTLYKPSETTPIDPPDISITDSTEPQWLQEIDSKTDQLESLTASEDQSSSGQDETASTFYVPLDSNEDNEFEPLPRQDSHAAGYTEDIISASMFSGSQSIPATKLIKSVCWRNSDTLKEDNGERRAYSLLKKAHQDHLNGLVQQMLCDEGLSKTWTDIVIGTAQRVSNYVRPDVREEGDDMNILKYVKFKKIPGDSKEQTWLVHGVVFTRNIAHKQMSQKLVNPYILLLKGSIEYQRVENKFSSLEPQILQEEEFLKKSVKKISSLHPKPNIVIVEKSVSRLAQNYLLEKGITLVYNVKLSVMEKIERLTQGCIVPSIDGIVSGPITLGFCHNFKVCHFNLPSGDTKTLLCFDGCAQHLGCTIVLRGGSKGELTRIKKVVKLMITACYNSQLEMSYCMDEFAMPDSRADDSSMETDSVINFTEEKTGVKVSDYLLDSKSGVNLLKLDLEDTNKDIIRNNDRGETSNDCLGKDSNQPETNSDRPVFNIGESDSNNEDISTDVKKGQITMQNNSSKSNTTENLLEANQNEYNNRKFDHTENVGSFVAVGDSCKTNTHNMTLKVEEGQTKLGRQHSTGLIPLNDQSDPLYMYQKNQDDAIFHSTVTLEAKTQKRCAKFKKTLAEILLSTSPYIKFELPYLETEFGSRSNVRNFFKDDLFWSKYFEPVAYREKKKQLVETYCPPKPASPWSDIEISEPHPLILTQITGSLKDKHLQHLIADFRARGGRIQLRPRAIVSEADKQDTHQVTEKTAPGVDCLDYSNHQKFMVLLSSHSENSTNYPNPCVPPQLVSMPFYSGQDMTLGGFLEKFCFRESYCCQPYMCPSENCEVPLLDHVRRIVHGHGSIFISLRKLSNCVPGGDKDIMMWNWCRKCRQATPLAAMSNDTWSLSFAKFLELRFYVNTFTRRMGPDPCCHSLHHSFSQYFGRRNIVATFKYMPVIKKEIVLPPSVISLDSQVLLYQWTTLRDSMRSVERRGLEMYSGILEQLVTINSSSDDLSKMIVDLTNMLESEKHRLKELIHKGRLEVTKKEKENTENMSEYFALYDDSLKMMRFLADADINWRSKMQELYSQHKKTRTSQSKKDKDAGSSTAEPKRDSATSLPSANEIPKKKESSGSLPISEERRDQLLVFSSSNKNQGSVGSASSSYSETIATQRDKSVLEPDTGIQSERNSIVSSVFEADTKTQPKTDTTTSKSFGEPPSDLNTGQDSVKHCLEDNRSGTKINPINVTSTLQDLQTEVDQDKLECDQLESEPEEEIKSDRTIYDRTWSGVFIDKSDLPSITEPISINQSHFLDESGIYSVTPGLEAGIGPYSDRLADASFSPFVVLHTLHEGLEGRTSSFISQDKAPSGQQTESVTIETKSRDSPSQLSGHISSESSALSVNDLQPHQTSSQPQKSSSQSQQLSSQPSDVHTVPISLSVGVEIQTDKVDTDKKVKTRKEATKKDDFTDSQQVERISGIMKKTFTNFLSGTGLPPLPFPFECREHHLLPTCYKVPVVVYDQEPSSIIAYALSSYDYQQRLQEIQSAFTSSQKLINSKDMKSAEDELDGSKKNGGTTLSFVKNKDSSPKMAKLDSVHYNAKIETGSGEFDEHEGFSILSSSLPESTKSGKTAAGPHIELQYSDHMAKFYCKIYFAEHFRKLRKLIFPAGEEMFIRSLSRCKMWEAKGGKSGSKFCKTDDQRFILKQMSGAEIDVFEKFGPEYFTYMNKSYVEQKPTALGKIVGVYRIGFRNTHTNAGMRQDLLVMENLFYQRKISQTFDLKGSERNRLASTSGKRDEEQVLLDTNLLNLSIESPLYIYPHSKTLLMNVISRDSQFLAANLVMDYSLLVGLDENSNELVLGIIDYIRTFTWDKKLETILKSAGGKLPTVVSPEIYKSRFLSAMTRYFLPVPDQWTGKDFDPTLS